MNEFKNRRSLITQLLVQRFRNLAEGELVTYSELEKLVQTQVRTTKRHYLHSAITIVRAEHDIILNCESGVGYRRLKNESIPERVNAYHRNKLVNDNARYRSKLGAVDVTKLNRQQKTEFGLGVAYLGVRDRIANSQVQERLKQELSQHKYDLSVSMQRLLTNLESIG